MRRVCGVRRLVRLFPVTILTRYHQAFCIVTFELAEPARRCSFNIALYDSFHREYEYRPDNVSDPGIPVSVHSAIELHYIPPNRNVVWRW